MTAKDLKNALLQEAVQGKLVPPACRQAGKLQAKIPSAKDGQWFVYVIECEDGSFYKGFTTDLQKRYEQHCNGTGADWTKTHKPKQLYYWEIHYSEESALQREKYLKSGVGREWFKNEVVDKPENWSSARDLLEEIRKEKSKLVKEGKLKKEKPLPEITEEDIPFDIPENWCWCRLGDFCDVVTGSLDANAQDENGKYAFFTCGVEVYKTKQYVFDCDAILLGGNNASGDYKMHRYKGKFNAYQRVYVISGANTITLDYFEIVIKYWLPHLKKNSQGTTTRFIKLSQVNGMYVPLPPLAEQKRIVAAIEKFMPLIEEYGKKETELKALNEQIGTLTKKAILQEAVQGKLVPQNIDEGNAKDLLVEIKKEKVKLVKEGKLKKEKTLPEITEDEIPFDIPENWCWCRLGEIVNKLTDGTHRTPKYVEKGIPFLSVKNLSSGKMDFDNTKFITPEEHKELYARCNPEKGDMLLTKVGTTGIPVINDSDIEFSLFVSVALIKFNHDFLDAKFFLYLLQSPLVQEQAKENTRGVGNKNWVMDAIANTILVLPPLAEQKRIVAAIEKMLPLCEKLGE